MKHIRTHYDNLKVARNAPLEVIRAAYKTLSQKYHPDVNLENHEAERIMRIINTAYEVLSDPEKRRQHDLWITRQENMYDFTSTVNRQVEPDPGQQTKDQHVRNPQSARESKENINKSASRTQTKEYGQLSEHISLHWVHYCIFALIICLITIVSFMI